ncbi:acriflavin resistance protein [Chthoniobacter flavus Ellin428]|uniref:Acriflavin resistance protein n=1 Tax=Chthoniobacter flavus Ellin428 TaxID=497964 RepID=B4DC66_9BACT|nr:efflux RND transporter permease subunit [Chthoniobacter flavus]EDY15988.1 acriflavin resistance protein [Chthoniobacter flavus Ellin428]TCO83302.1 CzcA family heavy metal efflux pump [Chthoniobacter flavus]
MWIVKIALSRPYTFIVLALLILFLSPVVIRRTPTDIFPSINIPVVSIAWSYTGLNPEDMEARITTPFEKALTTLVDNIEHIESTTYNGVSVVKVFLQPGASVDTANAQVVAASQFMLRFLPPASLPPEVINFSASSVPIVQMGLSGKGLSEQQLNDVGMQFVRTQIITVPGAVVPLPYGGKQRQMMINLDQNLMQSKHITSNDVLKAVNAQNLILPSGTAKIGNSELDVRLNSAPRSLPELGQIPIKQTGATTLYLRDVATVSDGSALQTNVVRQDGHRGVLLSILKAGTASTLDVVQGVRNLLPRIAAIIPPEVKMTFVGDQSTFVRASINSVVREGTIAAALTGLMILLFLSNWRGTLIIALSIPLSVLSSILVLSFLHETINIMTLGGLALAVGILVDDATVEIENIERNLRMGKEIRQAILDGAQQIAAPAFVSTLCICIVFLPVFLLGGVARHLFVPLAEAVVFAMLASYLLSRTLVPTLAMYLLRHHEQHHEIKGFFGHVQSLFERGFEGVRQRYERILQGVVEHRAVFIPVFLVLCLSAALLVPWLGQDFFPAVDSPQIVLHVRAKTGTRIEETARLCDFVENSIRHVIPARELDNILDNIGLPYSPMNTMHSTSGVIGANDADIFISLREKHRPSADYIRELRKSLPREFPGATFYFLPADMVTQILNFGLPSPIDIQIEGSNVQASHQIAEKMLAQMRHIRGLADLRIQQPLDYPTLQVDVDRTKASQGGYTEQDVASTLVNTLSGTFQVSPMFFVNWNNGVNYNLVAQTPQYRMQSVADLQNVPIASLATPNPEILGDVASIQRSHEMAVVTHYNIRRTVDIYGAVQDRDLGAVNRDLEQLVQATQAQLPRGTFLSIRGQVKTMHDSYAGLLTGLGFAVVLVYMLMVVNFQSWLDPFIIITALPAALAGIIVLLFFTHTTLSVPALMGALMCVGVATANSILVVSFAKERLHEHGDSVTAAIEAGVTRFRPVIMTALAMIIGMAPMAMGWGEGGEQNAPLGRAVIGGLFFATFATLLFVPTVFSLLHRKTGATPSFPNPSVEADRPLPETVPAL